MKLRSLSCHWVSRCRFSEYQPQLVSQYDGAEDPVCLNSVSVRMRYYSVRWMKMWDNLVNIAGNSPALSSHRLAVRKGMCGFLLLLYVCFTCKNGTHARSDWFHALGANTHPNFGEPSGSLCSGFMRQTLLDVWVLSVAFVQRSYSWFATVIWSRCYSWNRSVGPIRFRDSGKRMTIVNRATP